MTPAVIDFERAVAYMATYIAKLANEPLSAKHHNDAKRVLWPLLDDDERAARVMR